MREVDGKSELPRRSIEIASRILQTIASVPTESFHPKSISSKERRP